MSGVCVLFVHEIWSVDSRENNYNCFHNMSHLKAKMRQNPMSAGSLPQTPLGKLTALSQTMWLDLRRLLRDGMKTEGEKQGFVESKQSLKYTLALSRS